MYGKCPAGYDGGDDVWITNITFYSVSPGLTFRIIIIRSNKVSGILEEIHTTETGLVTHQLVIPLRLYAGYEFLGFYFAGPTAFGYCTNGTDTQSVTRYPLQIDSWLPNIQYLEVVHGRRYPMMIGTVPGKSCPWQKTPNVDMNTSRCVHTIFC